MPAMITQSTRPLTEGSGARPHHLIHLATAIREHGGTAVVALSHTAHPVLYVRYQGRTLPVVLIQGIDGGWWFIWGHTGLGDLSHLDAVAAHLAGADAPVVPAQRPPHGLRKQVA